MTTQTLYNQLLNEEITKDQFMYQIRRDERLTNWITPHLSFNDAVKILKNKGVINENVDINKHLEKSGLTSSEKSEVTKKIKDMGLTGDSEIKKVIDGFINTKVKTNLSKGFNEGLDDVYYEDDSLNENEDEDELFDLISRYVNDPDDAEAELDKFMTNGIDGVSDYVAANLKRDEDFKKSKYNKLNEDWGSSDQSIMNQSIHRDLGSPTTPPSLSAVLDVAEEAVDFYWNEWPEYTTQRDRLISHAAKIYYNKYFPEFLKGMQQLFTEGKKAKLKPAKLTPDQVNPEELRVGIRIEMEHTDDPETAKTIALQHLEEDPNYYTHLKAMEGEYKKKEMKDKKKNRTDLMSLLDDKMKNVIDKENGMKYVSDKEEKANLKDTLGAKEAKKGMPKKVKEMPVAPKSQRGIKKMALPGKEKRIKLSEMLKENIQDRATAINDFARLVKSGTPDEIANTFEANRDYPSDIKVSEMIKILKKYNKYDNVMGLVDGGDMDPAGGRGLSSHLEENKDSYNKEKIKNFISNVTAGYGWATDDYVTELGDSDGLNNNEQYIAMLKLASSGNLYDASQLDDKDQDERPTSGKVDQKWVEDNYGEMSNIKVRSKIRENNNKPQFEKGTKITYLGYPGEITGVNKEMTGDITYNVIYDKGQGKTKATNIANKDNEIKPLNENESSSELSKLENLLQNHDWYYDYSDDHSIYKRGRKEYIEIMQLVRELGDEGKKLYDTYAYKNKQFGLKEALDTDEDTSKVASTTKDTPEDKELKTGSEPGKPTYPSGEKKYGEVPTDFKLKMTNKLIQAYFDNPEKVFSIQKELAWYLNKFEAEKKKGNTDINGKNVDSIVSEYKKAIEFIKAQSSKKPIKENNSLKYSEELANEYGIQEYILKNSIQYEEDKDGGWEIEFNMLIPFQDVPEFDYPEEAKRYFAKEFNIRNYSGPGQNYSRGGVYETGKTNNGWLVQLQFEGGMDI